MPVVQPEGRGAVDGIDMFDDQEVAVEIRRRVVVVFFVTEKAPPGGMNRRAAPAATVAAGQALPQFREQSHCVLP